MKQPLIAIVGSPSVGKSTLFNRFIGERKSIVESKPGVTRDRIYGQCEWLTKKFKCVDTGGIEVENKPFQEAIRIQVKIAIDEADLILFVVDGKRGLTSDDKFVAKMLYSAKKPIILAVDKIDDVSQIGEASEFYALGLGEPLACSGEHGIGIGDILDKIVKNLNFNDELVEANLGITLSVIGRPNVGKSTLVNSILKEERSIVSPIEGTTRDAIDTSFSRNGKLYTVVDTAGLKKRGKIYEAIDKYAAIRSLRAIDSSDVSIFLIDGSVGITEQDKHVVGYALDSKKAIIMVVNKWDLVKKDSNTQNAFVKQIRSSFKFIDYVPILFMSALKGSNIDKLFSEIDKVYDSYSFEIKTSVLNELVQEAQLMNETPDFNGGRCKIYYAQQVSKKPLTIALFCNEPSWMHFSYLRYLENKLRDSFDLVGSPIVFLLRKRK
jgi:GTP-binding protein